MMLANTNAANLADPNDLLGLGITVLVPDDQFDESGVVQAARRAVVGLRRPVLGAHCSHVTVLAAASHG